MNHEIRGASVYIFLYSGGFLMYFECRTFYGVFLHCVGATLRVKDPKTTSVTGFDNAYITTWVIPSKPSISGNEKLDVCPNQKIIQFVQILLHSIPVHKKLCDLATRSHKLRTRRQSTHTKYEKTEQTRKETVKSRHVSTSVGHYQGFKNI